MTITIKQEVELRNFEAWSGGKEWLDTILEHEESESILALLTEILNDTSSENYGLTETEVNDFLWFDSYKTVLDYLDIDLCE